MILVTNFDPFKLSLQNFKQFHKLTINYYMKAILNYSLQSARYILSECLTRFEVLSYLA